MIVGVDIGGNTIKAVRLLEDGTFEGHLTRPTGRGQAADLQDRVLRLVLEAAGGALPKEVAMGIGGLVEAGTGKVLASGVLPRLRNCVVCEKVAKTLGVPVRVFSDSQMAAYGEWKIGAAQGLKDVILFAVGAGVMGGAISRGVFLQGHSRNFGGFGHISVDPHGPLCICGNRGCLSLLGSALGLARHYRDITHVDKSPEEVSSLVLDGDPQAEKALGQTCRCLAIAIGAAINFMDPEMVLISGGMASLGETLLEPLRRELMACVFPELLVEIRIECGTLGLHAGAMGAALFARDHPRGG